MTQTISPMRARPLVWANGQAALWRKTGLMDVVEVPIVQSFDYGSFEDYWSSWSTGPTRIAQRLQAWPPEKHAEIERHVRAGYLAGLPDGPRSFAIIVRAVRGTVPASGWTRPLSSNQAEVAQARVPSAADDQVIVHGHAERLGGFDDIFGDGDVRLGRSRVARGVVVHQDQRRGLEFERPLDHFAGIDRCVIYRSALLLLMLDQYVLAVEEQDVKLLDLAMGDICRAVIDELVPGADHRTLLQFRPHQPECGLARRLERSNPGEAETG